LHGEYGSKEVGNQIRLLAGGERAPEGNGDLSSTLKVVRMNDLNVA